MTLEQEATWIRLLKLSAMYGRTCKYGKVGITEDVGFTRAQLADLLHVTPDIWDKMREHFLKERMITIKENNVITIVNWRKYQDDYQANRGNPSRAKKPESSSESRTPDSDSDSDSDSDKEVKKNTAPTITEVTLSAEEREAFERAFPNQNVAAELLQANLYITTHAEKRYKNGPAFFRNWLTFAKKNQYKVIPNGVSDTPALDRLRRIARKP